MNTCPCCSHVLLRHIRGNQVYWFCRGCWQSMPVPGENTQYSASNRISAQTESGIHIKHKYWSALAF